MISESSDNFNKLQNIAGIVPIANNQSIFGMPWDDSLMPLSENYTAIEKAVYECAFIGSKSIWIVAHYGTIPLIKKRTGEFIEDPYRRFRECNIRTNYKYIPIYYVPVHPVDKGRRDSLSWNVLYGANSAYGTTKVVSRWTIPSMFYCSFPFSVSNIEDFPNIRSLLLNNKKIHFSYNGKSVKDNVYINFSFDKNDYITCRDIVKRRDIETSKRYTNEAKNYDLRTVFQGLNFNNSNKLDLNWHHDISSWDGYRKYMGSENTEKIQKLSECYTSYKKERYLDFIKDRSNNNT